MNAKPFFLLAGAAALYAAFVRPWHLRWGATKAEAKETLPGDELTPHVNAVSTHAITILAPAEAVWPWLAQIGQDKGGFYSYVWLENMVGCRMRNAENIHPEFQRLQAGDSVRLHPSAPPLPVLRVEPGRLLILGSNTNDPGTWAFYLRPLGENATRLIVRGRGEWKSNLLSLAFLYGAFEPIHFVMERKMLLGVKARAEHHLFL